MLLMAASRSEKVNGSGWTNLRPMRPTPLLAGMLSFSIKHRLTKSYRVFQCGKSLKLSKSGSTVINGPSRGSGL